LTPATPQIVPEPTSPAILKDARGAGVKVPCLPGYVAKTFRSVEEIPCEMANAFMLDYIATQAEIYERVNGEPVDGPALIASFWASIEKVLPPQGSYYLVWSEHGGLVGMGALRRVDQTTGEMKHLYVRPEARGTGLGRWLVEQRIRDARSMALKTLIADTLRGNVEMPALYSKLGFVETPPNQLGAAVNLMPHVVSALHFFRKEL
jgi:GNAT superfamily N-acetyltransferase